MRPCSLLARFLCDKLTVHFVYAQSYMTLFSHHSINLFIQLVLTGGNTGAAEPKRVLVVHSFVNAAPPFTTHSIAFETALTEMMGERVDLDEISLDVARYATLDM